MQFNALQKWIYIYIFCTSLHHILRSESFKFLFSTKSRGTEYKMWEIKLQKIVVNLLDKLRKLYPKETIIKKCLVFLGQQGKF